MNVSNKQPLNKIKYPTYNKVDFKNLNINDTKDRILYFLSAPRPFPTEIEWYQFRKEANDTEKSILSEAIRRCATDPSISTDINEPFFINTKTKTISGPAIALLKSLGKATSDTISIKDAYKIFNTFNFYYYPLVKSGKTDFTKISDDNIQKINDFRKNILKFDKPVIPILKQGTHHVKNIIVPIAGHAASQYLRLNFLYTLITSFLTVDNIILVDTNTMITRNDGTQIDRIPICSREVILTIASISPGTYNGEGYTDRIEQAEVLMDATNINFKKFGINIIHHKSQQKDKEAFIQELHDKYPQDTCFIFHNPFYQAEKKFVENTYKDKAQTVSAPSNQELDKKVYDPEINDPTLRKQYYAALTLKNLATKLESELKSHQISFK